MILHVQQIANMSLCCEVMSSNVVRHFGTLLPVSSLRHHLYVILYLPVKLRLNRTIHNR